VDKRQDANNIPERERVQISVITPPSAATVAVPHSYTAGIVLFLLSVLLGLGLAYLIENLRPSVAAAEPRGADADSDSLLEAAWDFDEPEPAIESHEHEHSVRDG
jgi:hypothetical protein